MIEKLKDNRILIADNGEGGKIYQGGSETTDKINEMVDVINKLLDDKQS